MYWDVHILIGKKQYVYVRGEEGNPDASAVIKRHHGIKEGKEKTVTLTGGPVGRRSLALFLSGLDSEKDRRTVVDEARCACRPQQGEGV